MSSEIRRSLERLVSTLAADPAVRAVGRSGGDRPLPEPGEGGIEPLCGQAAREPAPPPLAGGAVSVTARTFPG